MLHPTHSTPRPYVNKWQRDTCVKGILLSKDSQRSESPSENVSRLLAAHHVCVFIHLLQKHHPAVKPPQLIESYSGLLTVLSTADTLKYGSGCSAHICTWIWCTPSVLYGHNISVSIAFMYTAMALPGRLLERDAADVQEVSSHTTSCTFLFIIATVYICYTWCINISSKILLYIYIYIQKYAGSRWFPHFNLYIMYSYSEYSEANLDIIIELNTKRKA